MLQNARYAHMESCRSARNEQDHSLAQHVVWHGAEFSIGLADDIDTAYADEWIEIFYTHALDTSGGSQKSLHDAAVDAMYEFCNTYHNDPEEEPQYPGGRWGYDSMRTFGDGSKSFNAND